MKKKITVLDIAAMKESGVKIAVLTASSYQVARLLDSVGIPLLLVGDSAAMVEGGAATTLPATVEQMLLYTSSVVSGVSRALVVSDMPFASYQISLTEARRNACRFIKEAGAEAVKVEGGRRTAPVIKAIVDIDVPVMAHVGLTPQSVHSMGGYRVQGVTGEQATVVIEDAMAVEEAGAFAVVLEGIPAKLAAKITDMLSIPTIGIGAGPCCDGQVLVVNDMLGLTGGDKLPKFVKRYTDLDKIITRSVERYMDDVVKGRFPGKKHSY